MKHLFWCICFFALILHGSEPVDLLPRIQDLAKAYYQDAVQIRRELHRIPELCFEEKQTAALISSYLQQYGLTVQTGMAGTGLKAILVGRTPEPVVGLRADMDALPIQEATDLPYQSTFAGRMHACGHDTHMTNILISARILSSLRSEIPGTVVFVFQPCEEGTLDGSPSGAKRLIDAGVMKNPTIEAMLGHHIMPEFPLGTVAYREGPIMANVSSIYITIHGKSSHGALPHQGIDAIYSASLAIVQFQSLISRFRDPGEAAVLSIGTIEGGVRLNVIADRVHMTGTVRTFSRQTEDMIEKGLIAILEGLKQSQGIQYQLSFDRATRAVKNASLLTQSTVALFRGILGDSRVVDIQPMTVGEDFSAYGNEAPSFFFFLGTGGKQPLHSSRYCVDERIFYTGPVLFSAAAVNTLRLLAAKKNSPVTGSR